MSWFGSGSSALDEQVERATGSSLEDMALNLEISDMIRSKAVQPKDAMRSLKKRLSNKNPNVQLATLNLTDTCVKNGGSHFFAEIASREYLDTLTSLLRSHDGSINHDVRQKLLVLIQTWAVAAESIPEAGFVIETYSALRREGFRFPPREEIASSMYQSNAPPAWTDSDVCMRCREKFTFTNRKHHCRNCGNVFCGTCSGKSIELPKLGIMEPVRVDDGCYAKLVDKSHNLFGPADGLSSGPPRTLYQASMQPRDARVTDSGFDADMRRALEMSLEDAKGGSDASYISRVDLQKDLPARYPPRKSSALPARTPEPETETDPDLEAAIAASLQDMEEQKKRHKDAFRQQVSTTAAPTAPAAKSEHELTLVEAENINLFSTLVDRLQHQPPGAVLREPRIQELYESIGSLRPKLARTYGETMSKHDTLLDLHSKLGTVVRYYDRMLEERLSNTYGSRFPQPPHAASAPPINGVERYYTGQANGFAAYPNTYYQSQAPQTAPIPYGQYAPQPPAQQQHHQQFYTAPIPQHLNNDLPPEALSQHPPTNYRSASGTYATPADGSKSPVSQTAFTPHHMQQNVPPQSPSIARSVASSTEHAPFQQPGIPQSVAQTPQPSMESYYTQPSQTPTPAGPQHIYQQQTHHVPSMPSQAPPQTQPPQQQPHYQQPTQPPHQAPSRALGNQPSNHPQQQQQQQQWPQAPSTQLGYGQEAFPNAPHHLPDQTGTTTGPSAGLDAQTPAQPKVEESLIEL